MKIISTITAGLAVATVGVTLLAGAATPAHAAGCIYMPCNTMGGS